MTILNVLDISLIIQGVSTWKWICPRNKTFDFSTNTVVDKFTAFVKQTVLCMHLCFKRVITNVFKCI